MNPPSFIAHYRIQAKLGEGGMGTVYRATDTKLHREVAIKVLPEAFAQDADRMSRFTREAQVLASLNHPNIAAIYGIEQGAIVMELVEGEDLKGPIPFETAMNYSRQIAAGLEAAHEKGIVHRDLKPANIKVTDGGQIKLLDFGLAKATEASAATSAAGPTMSPTISLAMTQAGMILGTAAYMSPEQAKGKPVDRRADIWAFGVVLVEMLTGRAMYSGETVSETLAAVIMKEPEIPDGIPSHVRALLRRCLEKDPQYRLQSIGEARIAIERPAPVEAAAPVPTAKKGAPWWIVAAAAIPALVFGGLWWRATRPVDRPLQRFVTDLGPESAVTPRGGFPIAISADGRRLVYPVRQNGVTTLATRLLDQTKPTILSAPEAFGLHFFSPDDQWIGFFGNRKLWKVSVSGGAPIPICDALPGRGAAWGQDGFIYGTFEGDFLSRVPATGGKTEPVTKPDEHNPRRTDRWPQLLPGGETLLFTSGFSQNNYEDANIAVYSLKTQQYKTVQRGGYFGRYLPSGHLLYIHQGTLFAIGFDPIRLETRGAPLPMLDDVSTIPAIGAGLFNFSANGILVYHAGRAALETGAVLWMDKTGKQEKIVGAPGARTPKLSPDGKLLALSVNGDVVVHDPARGSTTVVARLAARDAGAGEAIPGTGFISYPVWMPDGKHIIYSDRQNLLWARSDGAGKPEPLIGIPAAIPQSIAPDGKTLAFHQGDARGSRDLYTVRLDLSDPEHAKAGKPESFVITEYADVDPAFSPDGRWLAYASAISVGAYHVFVRPFPEGAKGGAQVQISGASPGRFPVWSRTAKEIFYVNNDDKIMVVPYSVNGGTFRAGKPEVWSDTPVGRTAVAIPLDITPDGKRFVVFPGVQAAQSGEQDGVRVTFLLNFFDELKRRLP